MATPPPASAPQHPPPPPPSLHATPSPREQAHIDEALGASQTAIDAISTIVSISTWALAIIGIAVALIAFWGWATLREAAKDKAKQIANERFDSYLQTAEFAQLVKDQIEASIRERWEDTEVAGRLMEETREPGEQSPFPPGADNERDPR